jgi:cation-transporting ATPase 13A2
MLYPKPVGFKFYRDSIRFISVMAGIAVLAFCASVIQFIRLGVRLFPSACFTLNLGVYQIPWGVIIVRGLDLITVVVPPALPATLAIGTSFSLSRLRKSGIFCIAPARVNIGGKVNVCCFDKTGTLTEDGLDVLGVRTLDRHTLRFGELIEDVHDLPSSREKASFLHALASCHSLKMLDDNPIGDPLDTKMFEFTRWVLEEGHVAGGAGVIKNRAGDRPTALVQLVVRPSDGAQFKLEDALKGATRVS